MTDTIASPKKPETSLDRLKSFLNQLFQFETQDLDFGVYKILHYKKDEIKQFIDELLVHKVREQLQTLSDDQTRTIQKQIAELEQDDIIKGWLAADKAEKKTLEKFGKDKIKAYEKLIAQTTAFKVSEETENQIYNHITQFFSRYYDKGDFISKRRFGKNEKYVVPYNGEETHFHWANQDQYYIKSSETFQQYAFKVGNYKDALTVYFKLTEAQLEQGNVKADENNYFILSEKEPELTKTQAIFFFEYRPLSDTEKTEKKGNGKQDRLDEQSYDKLKKQLSDKLVLADLWKPVGSKTDTQVSQPLLLKKLHHYTRKNKYDFFIHKNLKGFLGRELDYYIKSELVNVDDLYVTDTDSYFDQLKHNLKTIKVFKEIADTIIEFVSQLENFQKMLWEKKKFVLGTEWVITIDRLIEYIGEKAARPILLEVIKNKKQIAEWQALFGKVSLPKGKLTVNILKDDLLSWCKLPIDTVHFGKKFRDQLLTLLSGNVNLEELADGLVIHSDNYHGLITLLDKYRDSIGSIYTDPPYNAKSSEIIYKNTFKHASWLSLMNNSLPISREMLNNSGTLNIAIDDYEYRNLHPLIDTIFGGENFISNIVVIHNPRGRNDDKFYGTSHEYMIVYAKEKTASTFNNFKYSKKDLKQYNKEDEISKYAETSFMRTGNNSDRATRPNLYYSIYFDRKSCKLSLIKENASFQVLLPINSSGEKKTWRWSKETFLEKKETELFVKSVKGILRLYKKRRLVEIGKKPKTIWYDPRYDASANGIMVLKSLFGRRIPFSYPKALGTVIDSIHISSNNNDTILDFFPGSGTTFHAIQILNDMNDSKRKCILTEQGLYTTTVILPRIKKIAYTFDWKNGEPKDGSMNGLGVFFKYQRLEQYEEALENIAFTVSEAAAQKALKLDQYIPKYFLEFETRESQTLVNTVAMADPWNYKLKVWDGFSYDNEQAVDLVETFNYLIGLHMQKCITKRIKDKQYCLVSGHTNAGKQILIIWRSITNWTKVDYEADSKAIKAELKNYNYDTLYINGQAHIADYQAIEEVFKNKMMN